MLSVYSIPQDVVRIETPIVKQEKKIRHQNNSRGGLLLKYTRLNAVFSRRKDVAKKKIRESMDCREREPYARGAYPTQHTSRMGKARVK